MLYEYNGSGKCCPSCGAEVRLCFDGELNYTCPECDKSYYSWECGNTMKVIAEDVKIQEELDRKIILV